MEIMSKILADLDAKLVIDTFIKVDDDTGFERLLTRKELLAEFECIELDKFKVSTIAYDLNDLYSGISIPFPIKSKKGAVEFLFDKDEATITLSINERLSVALRSGVSSAIEEGFALAVVGIHYKGAGFRDGFRGLLNGLSEDDRSTWSLFCGNYCIK